VPQADDLAATECGRALAALCSSREPALRDQVLAAGVVQVLLPAP